MSPGAIASPHTDATAAGLAALREGGTAVDAALAAAAMLAVVYPHQCGLGGDAIALVGTSDGALTVVNGSGRSARHLDPRDYDDGGRVPIRGVRSVTVPGVLSAWQELADRWGRHGLAAALTPAAAVAAGGFAVAPGLHRDLVREHAVLSGDRAAADVLLPAGEIPAVGDRLRLPALAETLTTVAARGVDAFYGGDVGASVVGALRELGGDLTVDDLRDHRTALEPAVSTVFRGAEYVTSAGNSQGGFFLLGLAALEQIAASRAYVPDPLGVDAGTVARVLAGAAAVRDRTWGDLGDGSAAAASPDAVDALVRQALAVASAVVPRPRGLTRPTGDTVAIVAADADGTWVSLIQSLFHAFGSGVLDPQTGIVLHNRGSAFTLEPGHPGRLGPGRRPPHTLMPVLVRSGDRLVGAHGTMGGLAQPQIHAQLALALARGLSPAVAVARPRWIVGPTGAGAASADDRVTVAVEAGAPPEVAAGMVTAGFGVATLGRRDDDAGHVQLVRQTSAGLAAASDPRADGTPVDG